MANEFGIWRTLHKVYRAITNHQMLWEGLELELSCMLLRTSRQRCILVCPRQFKINVRGRVLLSSLAPEYRAEISRTWCLNCFLIKWSVQGEHCWKSSWHIWLSFTSMESPYWWPLQDKDRIYYFLRKMCTWMHYKIHLVLDAEWCSVTNIGKQVGLQEMRLKVSGTLISEPDLQLLFFGSEARRCLPTCCIPNSSHIDVPHGNTTVL